MHPDETAPEGTPVEEEQQVPIWRGLVLALAVVLAVGGVLLVFALLFVDDDSTPGSQTLSYVIPAGTGARVDQGEVFYDLFPESLEVKVGDRLVVVNQDDRIHTLGAFTVRAGETLTYQFERPGTYRGLCTIHGPGHDAVIVAT